MEWFWLFLFYSFLGYLLERMFAKVTRSPRQVRKCFLILPLCPVYGLAMTAFLALTDLAAIGPWELIFRGGLICTLVEYLVHAIYEGVFGVTFWDYSGVPGNVWGRVCLPFSVAWGLLSAGAAAWLNPALAALAALASPALTYGMLLLLVTDAFLSADLLLRYHDTELLSLRSVSRKLEE